MWFASAPIQELGAHIDGRFDLVLCHAVLEWQAEPQATFRAVSAWMKPGGMLSLLFYNRHSLVWRNLSRGNCKVASGRFSGDPASLIPTHPLLPRQVYAWLDELGLAVICRCGVAEEDMDCCRVTSRSREEGREKPLDVAIPENSFLPTTQNHHQPTVFLVTRPSLLLSKPDVY